MWIIMIDNFIGRVIELSALKNLLLCLGIHFLSHLSIDPFENFLVVEEIVNWPFIYNQGHTAWGKMPKFYF